MIRRRIGYVALAAIAFLPNAASAQWAAPTQTPPDGNAAAPINVSSTSQTKSGPLVVGSLVTSGGLQVTNGTAWATIVSDVGAFDGPAEASYIGFNAFETSTGGVWDTHNASYDGGVITVTTSNTDAATKMRFGFVDQAAGAESTAVTILKSGNVGIGVTAPTQKLEVNGSAQATAFYYSSDRELKKDIQPLNDALARILKLEGVSFSWKDTGNKSIGLIAQDVEKVYPEIVNTDPSTGYKSVEYGNLVAPLIEAIQEQQKQIDDLKKEVAELKAAR